MPRESIGRRFSGDMYRLVLSKSGRCHLCSMTLPIVRQIVGFTETGGHLESGKCPMRVVTPLTFSCLIFRSWRPATWIFLPLVKRKITRGILRPSNKWTSEGRHETKSILAFTLRSTKQDLGAPCGFHLFIEIMWDRTIKRYRQPLMGLKSKQPKEAQRSVDVSYC